MRLRDFAQVIEHLPDGDAGDGIEAGGGLVEKEDVGIVDQAAGDFEAAAHSAGEGFGLRVAPLCQVDRFQNLGDVFFALGSGDAVELGVDAQVFFDGEVWVAGERLGNDADHAADRVWVLGNVVAADDGRAGGNGDEGGHHADQGAFACAVGAEQAEDFAVGN